MDIETKHASLATLAVTIQALHVNGKQMTLAVFRQLPEECDDDGGEHWGVVRYSVKDEGSLWLVFSKDGRLFRRELRPGVDLGIIRNARRMRENANGLRTKADDIRAYVNDIKEKGGDRCGSNERYAADAENKAKEAERAAAEEEAFAEDEKERASIDKRLLGDLPQLFIAV